MVRGGRASCGLAGVGTGVRNASFGRWPGVASRGSVSQDAARARGVQILVRGQVWSGAAWLGGGWFAGGVRSASYGQWLALQWQAVVAHEAAWQGREERYH